MDIPGVASKTILSLLCLTALPTWALDLNLSTTLEEKAVFAIPTADDEDDDRRWETLQGDTSAEFKLDLSQDKHSAFVDCALLYDAVGAGSSGVALTVILTYSTFSSSSKKAGTTTTEASGHCA